MSIDFYDCLTILPSFLTMGAVLVKYQKQKGEEGLPFLHLNVIEVSLFHIQKEVLLVKVPMC